MNYFRTFRALVVAAMAAGAVLFQAQALVAATGDVTTMDAKLQGKSVTGSASWIADGKNLQFGVAVQDAEPGSTLIVTARRGNNFGKIAWLQVGDKGSGSVTIHSAKTFVPEFQPGDLIEVWNGNARVASGRMALHK